MADDSKESETNETGPVTAETSAGDASEKVTAETKSGDSGVEAAKAVENVTEAAPAGDSLVSDVDPAVVQDNQNFDVEETKEDKKEGTGEPLEPDSSLLTEGGEELDFGDGDEHKEDMISFQIEESEIAIVETGNKEEAAEEPTTTDAKPEPAQGDVKKKEDKPSDAKEEEG